MSNLYFTASGNPVTLSRGASSAIRAEYLLLQAGFDKLPTPTQVWGSSGNYAVAGGSTNAWTASIAATYLTSYVDGMAVRVKFPAANTTTTPTLNLNSLGAKTIVKEGNSALAAADIPGNGIVLLTFNTSYNAWQIAQTSVSAAASAAAAAASASAASTSASSASTSAATVAASFVTIQTISNRIFLGDW